MLRQVPVAWDYMGSSEASASAPRREAHEASKGPRVPHGMQGHKLGLKGHVAAQSNAPLQDILKGTVTACEASCPEQPGAAEPPHSAEDVLCL